MFFVKNMFGQSLFSINKSSTIHFLGEIFPCTCEWIWWLEGPKSLQNKWISFQDMDWHGKAQVIDYLWVGLHLLQIGLRKKRSNGWALGLTTLLFILGIFWVYLPQRHECWSPQVICIVWWFRWFFQWGERPRMESPRWLQIFGQVFWCKKVWGMETPLVIDQVLAGLLRLVFAKTTWIQPILTKQFFKHFVLCHYFLTSERPSSLDSFCLWMCYWPTFKLLSNNALQGQGLPMIWGSLAPNLS